MLAVGDAITLLPAVVFRAVAGAQVYPPDPDTLMVRGKPAEMVERMGVTVSIGMAFTVMGSVALRVQPLL